MTFKRRLRAGDVLDGLARHGLWQEADEVAGVARLERYPYFTLSALKPPIPGPCPARGSITTKGRLSL